MMKKYEKIGNKLTKNYGLENKIVILYWKAWENESWAVCEKIYKKYKIKVDK